jgi:hypothetical protein
MVLPNGFLAVAITANRSGGYSREACLASACCLSLLTTANRVAYCHLCWTAAELVLACTASRAFQDQAGLREDERCAGFVSR